jgi:hypothetical protein
MRRLLLLIALVAFLSACSKPEEKTLICITTHDSGYQISYGVKQKDVAGLASAVKAVFGDSTAIRCFDGGREVVR